MPAFMGRNPEGKEALQYWWPAVYVTPAPEIGPALKSWRKTAVLEQEAFLALAKDAGRDGRFSKDEAKRWLRIQRAITLALTWFDEGEATRLLLWPADLAPEMDEIAGRIMLEFG